MNSAPFELSHSPFAAVSSVAHYQRTRPAESARSLLAGTLSRQSGFGLLLGASGTGKSTVLRRLAAELATDFQVVLVSGCHPDFTRAELLQTILFQMELPYHDGSAAELRLRLIDALLEAAAAGAPPVVLLVDEAHQLAPMVLEELRLLGDVQVAGRGRVGLVLAGLHKLEETLAHVELEPLNQRVAGRAYVRALGYEDALAYLRGMFASAGGDADAVFDDAALEAIYRAGEGVPRLMNQLADAVVAAAAEAGIARISEELVERTWTQQQQLPADWSQRPTPAASHGTAASIEFGELPAEGSARVVEGESIIEYGPLVRESATAAQAVDCSEVLAPEAADVAEVLGEVESVEVPTEPTPSRALVPTAAPSPTVPDHVIRERRVFDPYTANNPHAARPALNIDLLRQAVQRAASWSQPLAPAEAPASSEAAASNEPAPVATASSVSSDLAPATEENPAARVVPVPSGMIEVIEFNKNSESWLAGVWLEDGTTDGSTIFEEDDLAEQAADQEASPTVMLLTPLADLVTLPLESVDFARLDDAEVGCPAGRPVPPARFRHMFAQLLHGAESH